MYILEIQQRSYGRKGYHDYGPVSCQKEYLPKINPKRLVLPPKYASSNVMLLEAIHEISVNPVIVDLFFPSVLERLPHPDFAEGTVPATLCVLVLAVTGVIINH